MKQQHQITFTAVAVAASVFAFSALAQDSANAQSNQTDTIQSRDSDNIQTNKADNTARNVRDRDNRTLTPFDQGNNKADLATTAEIRKEIIAGKNMSVDARNVKIITNQGKVTLRGPVNTAEEKRIIGEIANRIAPDGNVDNQLEVKLATSSNN